MKKVLFAAIAAVGILAAGCTGDQGNGNENEGTSNPGSLRITIANEAGAGTRLVGDPSQAEENSVHSFAVIVFDYQTNVKEKAQEFQDVLTGEVTDLSTSTTKRVVVLVNHDPAILDEINNYGDLDDQMLVLETQTSVDLSTTGLFMSGEYANEVTLSANGPNQITVPVRRVVAKVRLGTLTVDPDEGYLLENFSLQSVNMQKVPYYAFMFGENIPSLTTADYRGGLAGAVSTLWADLSETYSLEAGYIAEDPLTPNIYFYVFPNDNSQDNPTMLTLAATYDNTPLYYTFIINDTNAGVADGTDGTYIKRNMVYTLNITLRRLGLGADNPDSTERFVSMEVTVNVADWEGELTQTIEW